MSIDGHMNTTSVRREHQPKILLMARENIRTLHIDPAMLFRDFLLMSGWLHFPLDRHNGERRQFDKTSGEGLRY
jgi:hypothetical protein